MVQNDKTRLEGRALPGYDVGAIQIIPRASKF